MERKRIEKEEERKRAIQEWHLNKLKQSQE